MSATCMESASSAPAHRRTGLPVSRVPWISQYAAMPAIVKIIEALGGSAQVIHWYVDLDVLATGNAGFGRDG